MFSNQIKTFLLMLLLALILMFIGNMLGGTQGAVIGLAIAFAMNFFSYWNSDKIVLKAYKAQPITRETNPRLYNLVERLTREANLPMPNVFVIPERQPNAFATGRNPQHAAVACTAGLLDILDDNELAGVISHELGHVKHRDILISTIAATFTSALTLVARLPFSMAPRNNDERRGVNPLAIVFVMLAPIAGSIIQMSISRKREFMADKFGGTISGNPLYLRNALIKLEDSSRIRMSETNPSYSHMFIINPLKGLGSLQKLFDTHPSTNDRIRELEKLAAEQGKL